MNILQSIRRAIRDPIIRFLAGDDLVIVGDIYSSTTGPALVYVPANRGGVVIGNFSAHDGPAVIVPRGCKPPAPTIRAVTDGDWGDARTWITAEALRAMVYGSKPQAGEGEDGPAVQSREPASVAAEARTPSDAAQAVLDAVFDHWPGGYNHPGKPRCVAAALRAAAVQVDAVNVPDRIRGDAYWAYRNGRAAAEGHLLRIAAELEGFNV
jgi:hypothetical protein